MGSEQERWYAMGNLIAAEANTKLGELSALRAFVRELSCLQSECTGQRQSIKERAEDLCEQWGIE